MTRDDDPFARRAVKRPCPVAPEVLELDARGQCANCGHRVHDLSAMQREQAHSVLARLRAAGGGCVALLRDTAGSVRFGKPALTALLATGAAAAATVAPTLAPPIPTTAEPTVEPAPSFGSRGAPSPKPAEPVAAVDIDDLLGDLVMGLYIPEDDD